MADLVVFRHDDVGVVLDHVAEVYGYGHAETRTRVFDQLCRWGNASLFYGMGADLFSVQIEMHGDEWRARVIPAAKSA